MMMDRSSRRRPRARTAVIANISDTHHGGAGALGEEERMLFTDIVVEGLHSCSYRQFCSLLYAGSRSRTDPGLITEAPGPIRNMDMRFLEVRAEAVGGSALTSGLFLHSALSMSVSLCILDPGASPDAYPTCCAVRAGVDTHHMGCNAGEHGESSHGVHSVVVDRRLSDIVKLSSS